MNLKEFFRQAREIRLSDAEKSSIRMNLTERGESVRSAAPGRLLGMMGREDFHRLAQDIERISLRPEERIRIRNHLKSSLRNRLPLLEEEFSELNEEKSVSFWEGFSLWERLRFLPVTALFLLMVAGVSLAADEAAPGDALYPVKLLVTENMVGALKLTAEARMRWDVERTERRLHEAVALAATEEFNPERTAALHKAFLGQVRRAHSRIAALAEAGQQDIALEVLAMFEAMLQAHSAVLSDLALIQTEFGGVLQEFIDEMNAEAAVIAASREKIEERFSSNAHVEHVIRSAELEMQKNFDYVSSTIEQGAEEHVDAKVKAAQASLHDAEAKFGAGADSEALSLVRNGLKAAEEAALLREVQEVRQTYGRSRTLTPWQLDWKPDSRRSLKERTEGSLERQEILREQAEEEKSD